MIAEKVLNGLLGTLAEMRDPLHPWRVELRQTVEKLIAELATDPQMRARAEDLKAELLASPLLIEQAKTLWAEVENGLVSGLPAHSEAIGEACARALRNAGTWLQEHEERKTQLNRRIRIIGERFLLPYRVESAPISSVWCATGTARLWSTGWSCRSARTCNISASTERWSAAWSAC